MDRIIWRIFANIYYLPLNKCMIYSDFCFFFLFRNKEKLLNKSIEKNKNNLFNLIYKYKSNIYDINFFNCITHNNINIILKIYNKQKYDKNILFDCMKYAILFNKKYQIYLLCCLIKNYTYVSRFDPFIININTLLKLACQSNNLYIVKLFHQFELLTIKREFAYLDCLISSIINKKNFEIFDYLYNNYSNKKYILQENTYFNILPIICMSGNFEAFKHLVEIYHLDPFKYDENILNIAIENNNINIVNYIKSMPQYQKFKKMKNKK
jgi:hypothetical protein